METIGILSAGLNFQVLNRFEEKLTARLHSEADLSYGVGASAERLLPRGI